MDYKKEVCKSCEFAKEKFANSCYCIKYGIIIGYSKEQCRGYEQVRQQKNQT